ncbi:hypothetical protein D187_000444 [Cystobacter fuscus DSM 2262]|uniref:Uncharacterized protein n=1 Tax=Cystobacter fuscus (strain ATCC 25194 / DSM 2262 / NBRC 100088 / M29) TaxID=1242864 RepID=S9QUM4_CYSF2|nr:hypothetical protein [Cystobacter fuscus]EPX65019.1 hypothetical protein D187_000444 [Cystobacter fuscus DSM 2262]
MTGERYTHRGSPAVERTISDIVTRAGALISQRFAPGELLTLALIGGYGRGEGGVDRAGGQERPHNNLDLMLVVRDAPPAGLKGELDRALEPLRTEYQVGIDMGLVTLSSLNRAPCRVMWYDVRHGHKTILGDAALLPSLERFRVEAILPEDVRDLLINRGTLLVINELLLARGELDAESRRALIRHTVKAIIGYGDALLFFRGAYHWSYVEKRRRMAGRTDVPEAFRRLYEEASAFRFEPDYAGFAERDLRAWMSETRTQLAAVHLACESARLGVPRLDWSDYPRRALRHALVEGGLDARAWLHKLRAGLKPPPEVPVKLGKRARLGLRLGGARGLMAAVFPYVTYGAPGAGREFARQALGAASTSDIALQRAYLRFWGSAGDPNFIHTARKLGLTLEDTPS